MARVETTGADGRRFPDAPGKRASSYDFSAIPPAGSSQPPNTSASGME
jgi:hypothetical protein